MIRDGQITDGDIAYWERLARSGVGVMITGGMTVDPMTVLRHRNRVEAFDEHALEGMQRRCDAIHAHGVVLLGQLTHLGREATGGESDFASVAPSAIRSPRDLFAPHELEHAEIAAIIHSFAHTALNLKRSGYDGAEIHGAHGYLVAQFLSPATNQRTDAYGGTAEKRLRFLRELIEAIRLRCGDDFLLSLRLSADEEIGDGLGIADSVKIAEAVATYEAVDMLNITMGVRGNYVKDASAPKGVAARASKLIREACGLPVIVGQRITTPALAEQLLADGAADLVGMARALIADPDWVHKAAQGAVDRIRPCLGVNQECRAFAPYLHCAVNPAAGRETLSDFRELGKSSSSRRIAVIGGGPGGLEAARVAASRGHAVTLFEATDGIGGQFLYAAAIPHRSDLRGLIDYQRNELRHLKVRMELATRIDGPHDLRGLFDAVIVATGARARPLQAEFAGQGVISWFEVLAHGAPPPKGSHLAVVVDDGSGFWWTYGVAEALAEAGWRLLIATPSAAAANNIPGESVGMLLARLGRCATQYRVLTVLSEVEDGAACLTNVTSGETEKIACDLIVMQTGRAPVPGPVAAFRAAGMETHAIGDCVTPRRMSHAVFEGYRAARAL